MSKDIKRAVVTVHRGVDKCALLDELASRGGACDIPKRCVEVHNERQDSTRNFDVYLTAAEADALRNDPRVMGVRWGTREENGIQILPDAVQANGYTFKVPDNTIQSNWGNWGLPAISSRENPFPPSGVLNEFVREYSLTGKGVDLVEVDLHQWHTYQDHPEWLDSNGQSRFVAADWPALSALGLPAMPVDYYTNIVNGHSTAGASLAAGRLYGLAKEAAIYTISYGGQWSLTQVLSIIRNWHLRKGTGRPTVVSTPLSLAYGYSSSAGGMVGGIYRGVPFVGNTSSADAANALLQRKIGAGYCYTMYGNAGIFGVTPSDFAAEVEACFDAGIVMVGSAGNYAQYLDIPGGPDFDNSVNFASGFTTKYCRGTCAHEDYICVGAIATEVTVDGKERIAQYSSRGPRVDLYAPGGGVIAGWYGSGSSAMADYPGSTTHKIAALGGTSFSAPFAAGMACLLMELRPWMTPAECRHAMRELARTGRIDESAASYESSIYFTGPGARMLHNPFGAGNSRLG